MYMGVYSEYLPVFSDHALCLCRSQKRVLVPLKLELESVVRQTTNFLDWPWNSVAEHLCYMGKTLDLIHSTKRTNNPNVQNIGTTWNPHAD